MDVARQTFDRLTAGEFDARTLALAGAAALLAYAVLNAIRNWFFSPISHIPGPRLAAATDKWALYHNLVHANKYLRVHELFEKYGPVVRTGPNTVTLANAEHMNTVYLGKWDKIEAYDGFRTHRGTPNSFSAVPQSEAQGKRRGMLPQYATSNLCEWQDVFEAHMLEMAAFLRKNGAEKPVDILSFSAHGLIDILGELVLDTQINAVTDYANGKPNPIATAITKWPKRGTFKGQLHPLLWKLAAYVPHEGWQKIYFSDAHLSDFCHPHIVRARAQLAQGDMPSRPSLAHRLSTVTNSMIGAKWPEADVTSECIDAFLAGTETTSTSLSYMMYTLSNRRDVMDKLQAEVDSIMALDEIPPIQLLARQPYLNAVIKESLRLFTPALGSLDRIVPKGGMVFDNVFLPAGTATGLQSYTCHRDPAIWPEPFEFKPERWLSETPEMKNAFVPFSVGGRSCPGQNLAMFDLRLFLSMLSRNFNVEPAAETTPASMEPMDLTTVSPRGGKVALHFFPRDR